MRSRNFIPYTLISIPRKSFSHYAVDITIKIKKPGNHKNIQRGYCLQINRKVITQPLLATK
jgi:hypothetical protein